MKSQFLLVKSLFGLFLVEKNPGNLRDSSRKQGPSASWSPCFNKVLGGLESPIPWNFIVIPWYPPGWLVSLCFHAKLPTKVAFVPYPWASSCVKFWYFFLGSKSKLHPNGTLSHSWYSWIFSPKYDTINGHFRFLNWTYHIFLVYFSGLNFREYPYKTWPFHDFSIYFSIYWEFHHPNWLSYFSVG